MSTTFHQRCASALTHPVTIAALATLLVNDLVFKALWPNPWTTGKLSDLAWVIFASPLLAFILSLFTRRSHLAQRTAFIIAYIGLPALYAAFNTFEPLHDLIIQGLLMLSGASIGSPFDPTDSLVIPFGLGIALWAWTRRPTHSDTLRARLALLMAGVAAFATVATPSPVESSRLVGHLDAETLVHDLSWVPYVSKDGGLTWQELSADFDRSAVVWGEGAVQTPRGEYAIQGLEIVLSTGGAREIAYSPSYLQKDADVRFQNHLDRRCPYNCPSPRPLNLIYDSRSGNVVVSTEAQGVVVGDSDGNWRQVAVAGFEPTDFSLRNKVRVLLDDGSLWLAATAMSILGTAFALMLLHFSDVASGQYMGRKRQASHRFGGQQISSKVAKRRWLYKGIPIGAAIVIVCLLMFFREATVPILVLALVLGLILSAPRARRSPGAVDAGTVIGVVSLACSAIAVSIGMSLLFTGSTGGGYSQDTFDEATTTVSLIAGLFSGPVAFMTFRPTLRQLPVVIVSLLAMLALFILAFFIGVVQGFDLTAAKFYAIILILIASITLWLYLRRSLSSQAE